MKTRTYVFVLLVFAMLVSGIILAGCSKFPSNVMKGKSDTGKFALDDLAPSKEKLCKIYYASKPTKVGDISHYEFEVRLGTGPYDVIRIHRVVREKKRYQPYPTKGNIFMVHGILQDFEDIYFNAGVDNPTAQTSIPVYLASKGIDVWGIDLAWTMIPKEATDFTFMKNWGIEHEVDHILAAMSIARYIRGLTGQGTGRMNLFGFSYSGILAYVAAERETQQSLSQRDISGLIPVENGLNVEDETRRQLACANVTKHHIQLDAGNYYTSTSSLRILNQYATSDPAGMSPLPPFSGFTNYQAALLASMASTFWHYVGVDFNADGIPVGLLYSNPDRWIKLLGGTPPDVSYMPRLPSAEIAEIRCGETDVPFDDHLADISLPILYIGAGGAFGEEEGRWTTKLTSSDDITIYEVSLQSEANRNIDFGHADLFIAKNAPELMWKKLYNWLKKHDSPSLSQR